MQPPPQFFSWIKKKGRKGKGGGGGGGEKVQFASAKTLGSLPGAFALAPLGGRGPAPSIQLGLVGSGGFQDVELTVHHVGAHVVILAGSDTLEHHLLGRMEVDEVELQAVQVVGGHADNVTVLSLERRAGENNAIRPGPAQLKERLL